ncbi:MAG TPA: PRC-barrel domain-containing protein [Marinagarivorans sp.]
MTPHLLSASSLNHYDVVDAEGEKIGKIKDVMIDWAEGRVGYVVLAFGGIMGLGEKLFAIPVDQFLFRGEDRKELVLNVSKEHLKAAPGFNSDDWPEFSDAEFTNSVYRHYSAAAYWHQK